MPPQAGRVGCGARGTSCLYSSAHPGGPPAVTQSAPAVSVRKTAPAKGGKRRFSSQPGLSSAGSRPGYAGEEGPWRRGEPRLRAALQEMAQQRKLAAPGRHRLTRLQPPERTGGAMLRRGKAVPGFRFPPPWGTVPSEGHRGHLQPFSYLSHLALKYTPARTLLEKTDLIPRNQGFTAGLCRVHPCRILGEKNHPGVTVDFSMPFLLCLKNKKSLVPLDRSAFQKHTAPTQQHYQALLEICLKDKCLPTDNNFPAHSSTGMGTVLKKLPQNLQWKGPQALHGSPVCYAANRKQLDSCQGLLENCSFLAALMFHQGILAAGVPQNQSFERKYVGIFHCWFAGRYGSQEDLKIEQMSEALVDFTVGVNIRIKFSAAPENNLWDILTQATSRTWLMSCQTHLGMRLGMQQQLVSGHAYKSITGIRKVTCYGPENLVRLRNPWGKYWKGDWSDRRKIFLRNKKEDGEFWMSLRHFKIHFIDLMICKLTPDLMSQEDGKKWMYSLKSGSWVKGSTGRGSLGLCTFWMNSQYGLYALPVEDSKEGLCSFDLVISLMQKQSIKHQNQTPLLFIGFSLYKLWRISLPFLLSPNRKTSSPCKLQTKFADQELMIGMKNPEINASQLQRIVNNISWRNSQSFHLSFSLDTCQGILVLLDYSGNEICNLMAIRYSDPDVKISFESFVCFLLQVKMVRARQVLFRIRIHRVLGRAVEPPPESALPQGALRHPALPASTSDNSSEKRLLDANYYRPMK
ncbi:LOW QUALITY PROTEIN: calpain-14 [Phaethornis superciliosus]